MTGREIVESFAALRPQAAELAEVVSFAVLVDRPLLRQARLRLVPDADAGAEGDLWLSPLVKSRSRDGITFTPEIAAALRTRLRADPNRTDDAWKLTTEMHDHLPPTLKLEERINRLSIDESAEAAKEIDELLSSVLAAMTSGGRDGLASWAARAFENFPTSVRRRDTARMVAAGASLRLGADPRQALGDDVPDWLRFVAPSSLPTETIAVELVPGMLRLDARPDAYGQQLRLPATRPYVVDVSWTASDGEAEGRQIALRGGDVQHLSVDAREVQLRTVDGEVYELRLGGTAPAEVRSYVIDFRELLERAGEHAHEQATKLAQQITHEHVPMTVVAGPPGSGRTTTLAQVVLRAQRAEAACAYHFFESGTPQLEYWESAERSMIAQLMTRYDAPAWAISTRLPEFLRMIEKQAGTGPVYLVFDNVDEARGFSVRALAAMFASLPPIFVGVASVLPAALPELESERVRVFDLKEAPPDISPPPDWTRRYLESLALARAPLPIADAERLMMHTRLPSLDVDGTIRRWHQGEPSITIANGALRSLLQSQAAANAQAIHHQLALAVSPPESREETWYGLYHGAWHWLRAGAEELAVERLTSPPRLEQLIRRFGAAVTADMIDEIRNATVRNVSA